MENKQYFTDMKCVTYETLLRNSTLYLHYNMSLTGNSFLTQRYGFEISDLILTHCQVYLGEYLNKLCIYVLKLRVWKGGGGI